MTKALPIAASSAVVMVAAAAAVRFLVVPALVQLPAHLDRSVQLNGTASLLDRAAIESGDLLNAIKLKVPITIKSHVRVIATRGQTAVVSNEAVVTGPDNTTLSTSAHSWAVDRKTLLPAPAPPGSKVQPHTGLVVGFPLSPQPHDYPFWDSPTQTVVTAHFVGLKQFAGRQVYEYTVHASGAVKDPEVLKTVPQALPLALTATSDATFWVDPVTSSVFDVAQKQTTQAIITLGNLSLPPITVFALDAHFSPEAASSSSAAADRARQRLFILRTGVPMAFLGLGVGLAAIAVRMALRRRRRPVPTAVANLAA